ncbi:hypothetical protein NHQ30_010529 [Ciborinia camelliae]|nr:hypothetical protein NHQ30_010529 [Ciborinia camelliae]
MAETTGYTESEISARKKFKVILSLHGRDSTKYWGYSAAIEFLDLLDMNEEEIYSLKLLETGKVKTFDHTPSQSEEKKRLEALLLTMDPSIPRYWVTKLRLVSCTLADRYKSVEKQLNHLKSIPTSSSQESVEAYESLLKTWSNKRKLIWDQIICVVTKGMKLKVKAKDAEGFMQMVFQIMTQQSRPRYDMFTKSLNMFYSNWKSLENQTESLPSVFKDVGIIEVWCAVTKAWGPANQRKAVHIVPSRISIDEMCIFFNFVDSKGAYSHRNGLILERQIQVAFETCRISIIPCTQGNKGLQVRVMDSKLLRCRHLELGCLFEEIHGRDLQFLSRGRPRKHFLHFHWLLCLAVSKLKRFDQQRISEEQTYGIKAWGPSLFPYNRGHGHWVSRKLIRKMGSYVKYSLPLTHTRKKSKGKIENYPALLIERICDVPDADADEDLESQILQSQGIEPQGLESQGV